MLIDQATRAAADHIVSVLEDCAVSLTGSRRYGYATADSDIDLFVFLPDHTNIPFEGARVLHQTSDVTVLEASIAGTDVQMNVFSYAWLHAVLNTPWKAYNVMDSVILHDPDGKLSEFQKQLTKWYGKHPEAVDLWKKQQESLRECSGRSHKHSMSNRREKLEFPTPMAFAEHLDTLYASTKMAGMNEGEQGAAPDADKRRR